MRSKEQTRVQVFLPAQQTKPKHLLPAVLAVRSGVNVSNRRKCLPWHEREETTRAEGSAREGVREEV